MRNCIFSAHCTEAFCDKSCPAFVETSYLMERNGISLNSFVFSDRSINYAEVGKILQGISGQLGAFIVDGKSFSTVQYAEIFTYCAICQNWNGNRLHCSVYNLKYSTYIEELKKSWTTRVEPESLEYMRIFSASAKVLIISNFDYVSFGDFETQTLLNLIQSRQTGDKTTLLITPPVNRLVSSKWNQFMDPLRRRLTEAAELVKEVSKK